MKLSKRKIISSTLGAIASVALLSGSAFAQKTMNIGFGAPLKSIYGLVGGKMKKHIEAETKGAIVVKLRHSGQIATEDQGFKAMQLGTADGFIMTMSNVAPHWHIASIFDLPYTFQNNQHLEKVLEGEVGDKLKKKLYQDTRIHLPAFGGVVYRDFFNSVRPINKMSDMKGIKIRVSKNKVFIKTYEKFGANPVPLAWSETPTALQTGTVQGGDNATAFIRQLKFYEHQKYLTVLEHFVALAPLFISDHFMKRLSPEQRQQVINGAKKGAKEVAMIVKNGAEIHRKWLVQEGGMMLTTPDKKEFIEQAIKVQNEFANTQNDEYRKFLKMIQDVAK